MSSAPYSLLLLEKTAWQLLGEETQSPRHTFAADSLLEQVPGIVAALADADQTGQPLVLGLAADWCLAATIDITSPQMLRKPTLIHYQLEEWIPWSAEEFVSDFIGHRQHAFCVAVRHEQLAPLLAALEAEDTLIAAIVPLSILALEEYLQTTAMAEQRLLWGQEDFVDLFTVRQRQLLRWSRLPSDAVTRQLQLDQLTHAVTEPLSVRGLEIDVAGAAPLPDLSPTDAATRISRTILAAQHEPSIDLRQGELSGKQSFEVLGREIGRLKVAAGLMVVCLAIACWIRAGHYRQATDEVQDQLATVHEKVFPGVETPERVAVAFRQAYRQLQGTRAPTRDLPTPLAADTILETVLQYLPEKLRFRLPEIRIEQERVSLGGEVRSNADADLIASRLRSHGFQVDPPRTQRLADQGFGVRLQAKVEEDQ